MRLVWIIIPSAFLIGCAGIDHSSTQEEIEWKGKSISFTIPKGWKRDAGDSHKGTFSMKPRGKWRQATMYVGFPSVSLRLPRTGDDYSDQILLSEQYLDSYRKSGFDNMGLSIQDHYNTKDGRTIWLSIEVSNQIYLLALIPQQDHIIQAALYGSVDDIVRYKPAFLNLLDSIQSKQ